MRPGCRRIPLIEMIQQDLLSVCLCVFYFRNTKLLHFGNKASVIVPPENPSEADASAGGRLGHHCVLITKGSVSMRTTTKSFNFFGPRPFLFIAFIAGLTGCVHAPPKPTVASYEPNFAYKTNPSGKKLDVTVGIIQPQFSANAALYHQNYRENEIHKAMLSSMGATFNEVLLAKGFNTKGPFVALNDMTFPEKKGSDLLLYPEFDFQIQLAVENPRNIQPAKGEGGGHSGNGIAGLVNLMAGPGGDPLERQTCDAVLTVTGNLLFVAQEPLSGERMWIKRLDVTKGK